MFIHSEANTVTDYYSGS